MKIDIGAFQSVDWNSIAGESHKGDTGSATWKTFQLVNVRARIVEMSADYASDHWCTKGHVFMVVRGETVTRLKDGREITSKAGMGWIVSEDAEAHRSQTKEGATVFIVD